jgi:hypothetical protein
MAERRHLPRTSRPRSLILAYTIALLLLSSLNWNSRHPAIIAVRATTSSRLIHRRLKEASDEQNIKSPIQEHALVGKDSNKAHDAQSSNHDNDDTEEDEDEEDEERVNEEMEENTAATEKVSNLNDVSEVENVKANLAGKNSDKESLKATEADDETDGDNEAPTEQGDDNESEEEEKDEVQEDKEENLRFKDMDAEADASNVDARSHRTTTKHQPNVTIAPDIKVTRGNITHPKIAWLMSFPNSGTSFTLHMTREASNTTTATNYAGEGDVKDLPSTQAIDGAVGEQGPFLELIRGRYTNMPEHILTKTHCTGFCSNCGPYKLLFETPRSFTRGCLSGTRAVHGKYGLELVDTIYDPKLVTKAIHIFRHPLDNTVARFHLEFNEELAQGNTKYVDKYPKNATGFQSWCARSDKKLDLFETRYLDDSLKTKLRKIPCFNEFFKFVQWHNMAFYTTHEMNLDVLYMHYHEYDENFERARDKVLKFLELPLVGLNVEWVPGKVYRHYYSRADKIAIKEFIQEYATRDTWNMVKDYDFEIDKRNSEPVVVASS